jgi:hypothetical protein
VFGNAGGSKSTFARQLAEATRLPLFPIDVIKYRARIYRPDSELTQEEYQTAACRISVRLLRWVGHGTASGGVGRQSCLQTGLHWRHRGTLGKPLHRGVTNRFAWSAVR